jgi:hypothetical protein
MTRPVKYAVYTAALLSLVFLGACGGGTDDGSNMPTQDIKTVMEAHVGELMAIEGVTAVAIGELDDGTPCIQVYVVEKTDDLVRRIPKTLGGHPVVVEESGVIRPMSNEVG